jgi:protein kinase-like protein
VTTLFQRVGPYEIVREIGRGGMATVFLAEDTRHSRKVALKLVSMTDDREGREILDAERWGAQLQGRLAEACGLVPRVYEAGEHPPYYFIAMEYVDGENLSDVIGRGKITPDEASRIACELCRFLDTAHRFATSIDGRDFVSLVHGDLKPRNVRLSPAGDIKVLDFGIAKALSLSRKVTRNDFGSMPYLSPERLESTDVDAHADLWALGVILYELLSGAPPFQALDTRRLEQQIRAGYQRRPLLAPCPAALQAVVARLLAPHQADRYESATAVLSDLRLVQSGQPTEAEARGFPGSIDEAPTRRTHPPAAADTEATRRTRSPVVAVPAQASRAPAVARPAPRPPRSHPVRTILMLAALLLACNELVVGFGARRAAANAMTRDLDAMDDVWNEYAGLSRRSYLRLGVLGLEHVLETRVEALAEQVMANYRSSLPTVRERQWRTAQKNLQQALILAPDNTSLKASLRYCEGHLHGRGEPAFHRGGLGVPRGGGAAPGLAGPVPRPRADVHLRARGHRSRGRCDAAGTEIRVLDRRSRDRPAWRWLPRARRHALADGAPPRGHAAGSRVPAARDAGVPAGPRALRAGSGLLRRRAQPAPHAARAGSD